MRLKLLLVLHVDQGVSGLLGFLIYGEDAESNELLSCLHRVLQTFLGILEAQ